MVEISSLSASYCPYTIVDDFGDFDYDEILNFNGLLNIKMPEKRKKLVFKSHSYNEPITSEFIDMLIRKKVEIIEFSRDFNQNVDNLPSTIKCLCFGMRFNIKINKFPDELTTLKLGYYYDHPLDNLPNKLLNLSTGKTFNHQLIYIPKLLRQLVIQNYNYSHSLDYIPNSVNKLLIVGMNVEINYFPDDIRSLSIGIIKNFILPKLPDTLRYLYLLSGFNCLIKELPKNIELIQYHLNPKFDIEYNENDIVSIVELAKKDYFIIFDIEEKLKYELDDLKDSILRYHNRYFCDIYLHKIKNYISSFINTNSSNKPKLSIKLLLTTDIFW